MLALDAAFPFDREAKMRQKHAAEQAQAQRLKIGIVGFGTFGQFLAKRMVQAGHEVRSLCAALRCAVLRVVLVMRFVVMNACRVCTRIVGCVCCVGVGACNSHRCTGRRHQPAPLP